MQALQQALRARSITRSECQSFAVCTRHHVAQATRVTAFRHRQQRTAAAAAETEDNLTAACSESITNRGDLRNVEQELPQLQLQLPAPTNTIVKSATFVKSSRALSDCPPLKYPEFAVIGRSNAGKSSLINLLTNRKSLAMVSKEPGKTTCINHFLINNSWYLVDLPGYGYARTGKSNRREFDEFTKAYFLQRQTLTMVFLLVDSSIPPQEMDLSYAVWLASNAVPFSIVFTKADKRKKGQPKHGQNAEAFKKALIQQHGFKAVPPSVMTSASSGVGKQELLGLIASLRVLFEQQTQQGKTAKQ